MKNILYVLFLCLLSFTSYAQVGIGVKKAGASTMLDVHSIEGDRGVLLPKVSLQDKGLFYPVKGNSTDVYNVGLIVFNKTNSTTKGLTQGYYYWTGDQWTLLSAEKDINSIIEAYIGEGNVFFGKVNGGKEEVLYVKKKDDKGKEFVEVIDVLSTLVDNIKNSSNKDTFEIRKILGYDITEDIVFTGKTIKGQFLYSFYSKVNVEEDNAEIEGPKLSNKALKLLEHGEIFNILVVDKKYKVVNVNTTDIEITKNGILKFSLGLSSVYMTLPSGEYGVIIELLSSVESI